MKSGKSKRNVAKKKKGKSIATTGNISAQNPKKKSRKELFPEFLRHCALWAVALSIIGTVLFYDSAKEETSTQIPAATSYFFVNDYCQSLTQETEELIQTQAVALYEKTKAQVCVVMVPDTQTLSLEDYSNQLANEWGIGDADLDNGVLILFTTDEPHVRIEVGNGLQGCLNDAKCGRILDDWAVDAKDQGRWNEAVINTWVSVAQVVYQEYGLDKPDTVVTVTSVSEEKQKNTMADAEFPEILVEPIDDTILERIVSAFEVFWFIALIPYLVICLFAWFGSPGNSPYGSESDSSWSSGDGGGDYSGGGGDFDGGGASR